jgi:lipoprotein-anchoring transpeptidase ErfK/SrfK
MCYIFVKFNTLEDIMARRVMRSKTGSRGKTFALRLVVPAVLFIGLMTAIMVSWSPLAALTAPKIEEPQPAIETVQPSLPTNESVEIEPAIMNPETETAEQTAANYQIKGILTLPEPLRHGAFYWDESNAPATGKILITVDLTAQSLSVFRGGYEIGVAAILYGADHKPTPTGVYPITQKKRDHISNLYGAPMPFMQRLTNDGVAIHGSDVIYGGATHGCVGVPTEFAELLFGVTKLGDIVIVTDGQMMQQGDTVSGI